MKPTNPIILALDYDNLTDAERVLSLVRPHIGMVKIGTELFTAHGRDSLDMAKNYNIPVFLDLKLHDIPKTVGKTLGLLCGMLSHNFGTHFVSVHCFGGKDMLTEAVKVCRGSNVIPAGVTLLTSVSEYDLGTFGFRTTRAGTRTVSLAWAGATCIASQPKEEGLDTFVCAPANVKLFREHMGDEYTVICPGIRSEGADQHDHLRAKPASFALRSGATWLVIGRPITQAPDPLMAAQHFEKVAEKY